jgi:hypothetical protein
MRSANGCWDTLTGCPPLAHDSRCDGTPHGVVWTATPGRTKFPDHHMMIPKSTLYLRRLAKAVLRILHRCPTVLRADDRRYDQIEAIVTQRSIVQHSRLSHRYLLYPDVVRDSIDQRCNYRVIDPAELSPDDRRFLDAHGLSLEFIVRNKDEPYPPAHGCSDGTKGEDFQLRAIMDGSLATRCPYTGRIIHSNRSFLAAEGAPIFYRYEHQDEVFYLAVGIPGIGYQKLYFYFPVLQAVVLIRSRAFWHGRANIDALRALLICNWQAVRAYVAAVIPPVVTVLVDNPDFAHHLWNDLTGIDRLLTAMPGVRLPPIVVCSEPFSPLDAIFPALDLVRIIRERSDTLFRNSLRQNRFLVRIGDKHIHDRVIAGLSRAAERLCGQEMVRAVRHMRQEHWPILWVTIRTGNRTWVSQCVGIPCIVNDLLREFPRLALIIDGFCLPHDHPAISAQEQDLILAEEMACVRAIRARLPAALMVRSNVGRPLAESVLFAGIADCYLSHHGSLQHKIGWIANCPGVVHSNRDDLCNLSGRRRALSARHGAVLPSLLDPATVLDVGGGAPKRGDKWNDTVSNYDFDYRVARDALLEVIRPLPSPSSAV